MASTRAGGIPYNPSGNLQAAQIKAQSGQAIGQMYATAGARLGEAVRSARESKRAEKLARDRLLQDQSQFDQQMGLRRDLAAIGSLRDELTQVATDKNELVTALRLGGAQPDDEIQQMASEIGDRERTLREALKGRMSSAFGVDLSGGRGAAPT